jgi:3-oxoacyl-[acyl-carrier protein] reductase
MDRLKDRVALVTGGARGLGLAIAKRFHEEGARVIINDLREADAVAAAEPLGGLGLGADVADAAAVRAMFERVSAEVGRLDILVNNAGINGMEGRPEEAAEFRRRAMTQAGEALSGGAIRTHLDFTVEMTDEDWRRMLGVHLDGTFFCTREALKIMGPQLSGSIINMGSIVGTSGVAGAASYAAAKGGILGFTRAVAREVISRNIRVNAIAPGWIETDLTAFLGEMKPLILAQTPMRRLGDPDDVAWAAVYLASEESKFMTGQVISPNGGWTMNQ